MKIDFAIINNNLRILATSDVHIGAFTDKRSPHPNKCMYAFKIVVDKAIDAVGYQATSAGSSAAGGEQDEVPNIVLNQLIEIVNPTGALGIPGLYVPSDPGGVDENAKRGALSINFGQLFEKGLRLGTGQCNVKQYNAYLRDLIIAGRAQPDFVAVSYTHLTLPTNREV